MTSKTMYLSEIRIENFRLFGEHNEQCLELSLKQGLTALVGENDRGKSAIIDALRFALGTTDQERLWLDDSDFNARAQDRDIRVMCKFQGLTSSDQRAFLEYLTYGNDQDGEPVLYLHWTAKETGKVLRGRPYRQYETRSGANGDGPEFAPNARELLRATYLRPLRDAEQALSAGRGSRLAQVLHQSKLVTEGADFSPDDPISIKDHEYSVHTIAEIADSLLSEQKGVKQTTQDIDDRLKHLVLHGDSVKSTIKISGTNAPENRRIRQMLEKLDLSLHGAGRLGLGSNNLLFMACELLLLAQEDDGVKLLLIEEPEAHLHAQRQLRAMKFLQQQAKEQGVQVIVTTHSPNLASVIDLQNIVMIHDGRAYSMDEDKTELSRSDYRFLQRFLDVTKANLFFARAVVIVEGDAENILLPALARLIGRDFTDHGVSVVNVGGVGLRRYARIFQRKGVMDEQNNQQLAIPIACLTDLDVMPDCAPGILGLDREKPHRRWRTKCDFTENNGLTDYCKKIIKRASGQRVKTFVSDEWTLEYNLALGPADDSGQYANGLAEDVFAAACLAENDDAINAGTQHIETVSTDARQEFNNLRSSASETEGSSAAEVLATQVYAKFANDRVSKSIAAQYLAEVLHTKYGDNPKALRPLLPKYIVEAIEYVTARPTGVSSVELPQGQANASE